MRDNRHAGLFILVTATSVSCLHKVLATIVRCLMHFEITAIDSSARGTTTVTKVHSICSACKRLCESSCFDHDYTCISVQEKDDWIGAIGRAIVQSSSTYQNDHGSDDSDSDYDR
jgi:hypothetical protein